MSKKNPALQFGELSQKSNIQQNVIQGQLSTSNVDTYKDESATNEGFKYKPEQKYTNCNCKDACIVVGICIFVIIVMIVMSVVLNNVFSQAINNKNKIDDEKQNMLSKQNIDNQYKGFYQNIQSQIDTQKDQIKILKSVIVSLQTEINLLKSQVSTIVNQPKHQKQKENSQNKKNNPSHQTRNQNQINSNPHINQNKNQTQPPKPKQQFKQIQQHKPQEKSNQQNKPTDNPNNQTNKQKIPQFTLRQKPRSKVPQISVKNHYEFSVSIDNVVSQSSIGSTYINERAEWNGIKKSQFQRAIRLMEVVHNINFKGQFVLDHYKYYLTPQEKYKTLSKLLEDQKAYYDKKYQINKYIHDQIGMCINLPSYNNALSRIYLRNLDSIFQQEYQNYHLVYVNDASTDGTGDYVKAYMEENQIPPEKYTIINNQKNQGGCSNIYMVAKNHCKQGEVMVLLDGDDALIGRQVFSLLNAIYQKQKVALTYGQFLMVRENRISGGFARAIPVQNLQNGNFRQLKSFYSTHLKTMYSNVMRQISATDLQYPNGTFYDYASDVTFMTPAIELVGTRLKFLSELIYEYRFDTGINQPHNKQVVVQQQVYTKQPYKKMSNMSFADNPKTIHYP